MPVIDRQLTEYFTRRGIDLASYVDKPTDAIDAEEIDDLETRLTKSATGITDEDLVKIDELRALAGRKDLTIQKGEGQQWGTKVSTTLTSQDVVVLTRHLPTSPGMGITIDGASWDKLVALRQTPGSGVTNALLSRIARAQAGDGEGKAKFVEAGNVMFKIDVIPKSENLSIRDLEFIQLAYRVTFTNGRFDSDALRAIGRASAQNGMSAAEQAMLDRIYAASTAKKTIQFNGVDLRIDVDTPSSREITAMCTRYGIVSFTPADISTLSRAIDTDGEAGLVHAATLRRVMQAHGREIVFRGGNKVTLDVKPTGAELATIAHDYFAYGFDISDGKVDATDLEALAIGFNDKKLGQTERETLMMRFLAPQTKYDVKVGDKTVEVNPFSLTASDVTALIDIYGLPTTGKDPAVIDHAAKQNLIEQMGRGGVPAGIAATLRRLKTGEAVDTRAFATWRTQVQRRLELLLSNEQTSVEHKALATRLDARLKAMPFIQFKPSMQEDMLLLRFATELLSAPNAVDSKTAGMLLRLDRSNGEIVRATDGRSFKVSLAPPPAADASDMDDKALHKYLVDVSRMSKGATATIDSNHITLRLTSRDELKGEETNITTTISKNGVAVRAMFDSSFPVHPDVWLGFSLGGGASYERNDTTHHVRAEGKGGANLTWYMNRNLRMRLDVKAYVTASVGISYDEKKSEEAQEGASADFEKFRASVEAKSKLWKDDVLATVGATASGISQTARTIIGEEIQNASGPILNAMMAYAFAQLTPSPGDDTTSLAQMTTARDNMLAAIESRLGREAFNGDAVKAAISAISQRTDQLFRSVETDFKGLAKDAGNRVAQPFNFSYGVAIGGDITWQARIPMLKGTVGTLYFSPYVQAFVNVPVLGKDASSLLSTEQPANVPVFGGRVGVGLDMRIGASPFHVGIFGGMEGRARVDSGKVTSDMVTPFGGLRLFSEW